MKAAYWVVSLIFIFFSSSAAAADSTEIKPVQVRNANTIFQGAQTITAYPSAKQCYFDTNIPICPIHYNPRAVVSIKNVPELGTTGGYGWYVMDLRVAQEPQLIRLRNGAYQVFFPNCTAATPRALFGNSFYGYSEQRMDLAVVVYCVPAN